MTGRLRQPLRRVLTPLLLAAITVGLLYEWIVTFPFGLLRDDGYFYAQLAYNLGTSFHSSFDGLRVTDGYHPLWGWALGGICWLVAPFSDSKHVHMGVLVTFDLALIYAMAARYGSDVLQRVGLVGLAAAGSLLMESLLLALLVLEWTRTLLAEDDPARPRLRWKTPLLGFLVPLARIDGVAVLAAMGLYELRFRRRELPALALAGAAGVLCHFVWMQSIAGSLVSVSSYIEGSRASLLEPKLLRNALHGSFSGFPLNPLLVLCAGLGVASLSAVGLTPDPLRRRPLLFAWLGVALFTGVHLWLRVLRPWYYTPSLLVFAYLLFQARPRALAPLFRLGGLGTAAAAIALIGFLGLQKARYWDDVTASREFIARLSEVVPEGQSVFAVDGSGYVGYFAARSIVNGDGLVNTHEYARALVAGDLDLAAYFRENEICWILTDTPVARENVVHQYGMTFPATKVELVLERGGQPRYHFTHFKLHRLLACA